MYNFITERYPQIVDEVSTQAVLPFCDVYLHLNGYIETCVNRSIKYPHATFDESIFLDLIQHIEHVLHILRPQKNLFLFLDGVIPCALHPNLLATRFLNEQSRLGKLESIFFSDTKKKKKQRFKVKKESFEENQLKHDSDLSLHISFDSHNTLPGTPFMNKLEDFLIYYIKSKLDFDLTWKNLNVIFSGSNIPGEGRHKILSFLRQLSTLHDAAATRRCVYTHHDNSLLTCLMAPVQNLFLLQNIATKEQCIQNQKINFNTFYGRESYSLIPIHLIRECLYLDIVSVKTLPMHSSASLGNKACTQLKDLSKEETINFRQLKQSSCVLLSMSAAMGYNGKCCVNDFVFLCILCNHHKSLRLPFVDMQEVYFHQVLSLYNSYICMFSKEEKEKKSLIDKNGMIQWENLLQFLQLCENKTSKEQTKGALKSVNTSNKPNFNISKSVSYLTHSLNEAEQFASFIQKKETKILGFADVTALPIFNTLNRNAHTFPTLQDYEVFYYSWYFGWNLLNESDARKIHHVVLNYCKALQWTFSYYFYGAADWYWSYPYRYPPLFSSFLKFVPSLSKLQLTLTPTIYSCSSQLLALLPSSSVNLLPENYQKIFLSERLTKFSNSNNLLSVMKNVHFTFAYFKNFQAFLQKNAHFCVPTPQANSRIALLFKKDSEKIKLQPSLIMTEWEHSLVDKVCKKVKNFTTSIINDNFKEWYQTLSIKDDLHYPFPMLSYLDVFQVSLESSNKTACVNHHKQGTQLQLHIHCWESFKQSTQNHSSYMEDACFQLLYEHFHDKTLFFDYPHQNAGKLVGIFGKNWFFRRRDFNDLNENEMHCDLDISQLQMYSNSVAVEKSSKKSSFLYIASAHCPKAYNQILQRFHSESHKLGFRYDFSNCPITSDMMKKILEKALHAGHKKKFRESYASLSYSPEDIFIEILPLSDMMVSQTKIKYTVKAKTIYRPFCLLYQNYPHKFSTNTKRNAQKIPLSPGSHVMCVNSSNPLFGCTGILKSIGDSSSPTEAIIHVYQESYDERWTMQKEMYEISANDLKRTEWYYIEEMSQMLDIPSHVLQALSQFLWIETNSHVSLDIGLNLVSFEENNIFCVPSYTSFIPDYNEGSLSTDMKPLFSKACIDLLRILSNTYHSLVDALIKHSREHDKIITSKSQPIKISNFFSHNSFEKTLLNFVAWRNQQPVFHMCRATPSTQSLSLEGIKRVEQYQKQWFQKRRKCFKLCMKNSNEIYPIEQGMLPDVLLAASPLKYFLKKDFSHLGRLLVGQRVVYAKMDGLLPFGAFGCVSATTIGPDGLEQWVELITEQRHLSCTDLARRCSPFRGIRVPASSLISIVPVILPWGLSIASLLNYQALIQESVQQLQLYHQNDTLDVWHSDSPIMRQVIAQMKTLTTHHEIQFNNKKLNDSVKESKTISQDVKVADFSNKKVNNVDEKCENDDKPLSTVERLLQYKIKLHQNEDTPAQIVVHTDETLDLEKRTEYPSETLNQEKKCFVVREIDFNKTQKNCQKELVQLLKSFKKGNNTRNLPTTVQNSNKHSLCFANIQSTKTSEYDTKIYRPQFPKMSPASISQHQHFDNFSGSGHELLTLLQQPPKSSVFVSQTHKKKIPPTSDAYMSHHRRYSNKDKFSSVASDNVPFLFNKRRGKKCLPLEMSQTANQRCYSKSDQHLIRILKHNTVNNPVAPACIPTFHPRQSH